MNNELRLRVFAGLMVLVSVALVHFVSPWWLLFTAFIGLNLIQSAFTGFCPPLWFLRKLFPESPASCGCDGARPEVRRLLRLRQTLRTTAPGRCLLAGDSGIESDRHVRISREQAPTTEPSPPPPLCP